MCPSGDRETKAPGIGEKVERFLIATQDWTDFRNLETLPRKGVSSAKLPAPLVKGVVDKALDAAGMGRG